MEVQCLPALPHSAGHRQHTVPGSMVKDTTSTETHRKERNKNIPGNALPSLQQFVMPWVGTVHFTAAQRCRLHPGMCLSVLPTLTATAVSKRMSSIFFRTLGDKPQTGCSLPTNFFQGKDVFT